jgi:hypothetical protein
MTDLNRSDRNVNRAIRSWLHEDRHEDVSRIAGAVLDRVDTVPQRRATWWPAWRFPVMNNFVRVGIAAAAVLIIVVVAINLVPGSTGPGGEPSASPSAAPSMASTATPGASQSPEPPPPLTQTFTSTLYGYSVSYPKGWAAQAATEPWTADSPRTGASDVGSVMGPQADWLYDLRFPIFPNHAQRYVGIASQPIGDSSPEDWVAAQMAREDCGTPEPITVDGATGLIQTRADCFPTAVVTTAGRGYWFQFSDGLVYDYPWPVIDDMAWFQEILATVQLHPEEAVD